LQGFRIPGSGIQDLGFQDSGYSGIEVFRDSGILGIPGFRISGILQGFEAFQDF